MPGVDLASLDLSRTSVFIDFDGTITTVDVGVHVLTRAAPDDWRAIDEQFRHGVIDSRECILDEWDLVEGDEATLRAIASEVALDPGVGPLVDALRAAGADLTVVSDGFGFYVEDAVRPFGLDVLTNAVDFTDPSSCSSPTRTGAARARRAARASRRRSRTRSTAVRPRC